MKTYYYHFNKWDKCFWAMVMALILAMCVGGLTWGMFIVTALVWGYKNVLKQPAVILTNDTIKIDHSRPIAWKNIAGGEIKTVFLCGKKMKVLALYPKKGIQYRYNWLQKHNANFGPFPIPLYGLLTAKEEKEIIHSVKKHVKVQG